MKHYDLKEEKNHPITDKKLWFLSEKLLGYLAYLQGRKEVPKKIDPENILLNNLENVVNFDNIVNDTTKNQEDSDKLWREKIYELGLSLLSTVTFLTEDKKKIPQYMCEKLIEDSNMRGEINVYRYEMGHLLKFMLKKEASFRPDLRYLLMGWKILVNYY